jgi:hypothetical protein
MQLSRVIVSRDLDVAADQSTSIHAISSRCLLLPQYSSLLLEPWWFNVNSLADGGVVVRV